MAKIRIFVKLNLTERSVLQIATVLVRKFVRLEQLFFSAQVTAFLEWCLKVVMAVGDVCHFVPVS